MLVSSDRANPRREIHTQLHQLIHLLHDAHNRARGSVRSRPRAIPHLALIGLVTSDEALPLHGKIPHKIEQTYSAHGRTCQPVDRPTTRTQTVPGRLRLHGLIRLAQPKKSHVRVRLTSILRLTMNPTVRTNDNQIGKHSKSPMLVVQMREGRIPTIHRRKEDLIPALLVLMSDPLVGKDTCLEVVQTT